MHKHEVVFKECAVPTLNHLAAAVPLHMRPCGSKTSMTAMMMMAHCRRRRSSNTDHALDTTHNSSIHKVFNIDVNTIPVDYTPPRYHCHVSYSDVVRQTAYRLS
jgi:hypothetical protein